MGRLVETMTRPQLKMADNQTQKDPITAVGPGADEELPAESPREGEGAGEDYQYPVDEHAQAEEDERTGHSEEEEPEEGNDRGEGLSREQRRRRRKRARYESDQRELSFLRVRNEQLEREQSRRLAAVENRQTQSDVLAIDGRISQAENDVREAETLYAQARRNNDPDSEIEALRVRDQLREGLQQLKATKQQTMRTAQARQEAAAQPAAPDPAVAQRAQEWARGHAWFDPQGRDEASAVAYAVERRLLNEGRLDPSSDEYWEEVDRRLAKRLPEHYRTREEDDEDDEDDEPQERRPTRVNGNGKRRPSGPTIKVGGRERTLKKGEVYIDEDRKAAMIEAGVWDDPSQRERYMRSYQRYDREAGRRQR